MCVKQWVAIVTWTSKPPLQRVERKHTIWTGFRRIRKNCTNDHTFEKLAEIIKKWFKEKGYPKNLVIGAYKGAKKSSQMPNP